MIPEDVWRHLRDVLPLARDLMSEAEFAGFISNMRRHEAQARIDIVLELLDNLPQPPEPDWSQAPEWAQWWAVDASGIAGWYEQEPEIGGVRGWELGGGGAWMVIETPYDIPLGIDWRTLKQRRPEVQG